MEPSVAFDPPARLLLGPGPSPVHPRVTRALAAPALGHLDPALLRMLDEIRVLLRRVFRTKNERTLAVSGTGMAGMEAVLGNLLEPGDSLTTVRVPGGVDEAAVRARLLEAYGIEIGSGLGPPQLANVELLLAALRDCLGSPQS